MTTTLNPGAATATDLLARTIYRDSWNHLNRYQRVELRKEYRFMRQVDISRPVAKGIIYRTVNVVQGWD